MTMERLAYAAEFKFADDPASGAVDGYASVFGVQDSNGDVVAPGAFALTLARIQARGFNVPMYLNHGAPMGAPGLPAGVWDSMEEDGQGLAVKGRLLGMNTETGRYAYELAKGGALRGLSTGFRTVKATYGKTAADPRRTLHQIDLFEASLVDDPANHMAVAHIKSRRDAGDIATIRDFEEFLRESGNFSRNAAKAIASRGFKAYLPDPRDEDGTADELAALLRRAASHIHP